MKKFGILENSDRGIWPIVPEKRDVKSVDPQEVVKTIRANRKKQKETANEGRPTEEIIDIETSDEAESWRSVLHHLLINDMTPDAFERLTKGIYESPGSSKLKLPAILGMVVLMARE